MAAAASEVFNHMIKMMRKLAPLVLSCSMDMEVGGDCLVNCDNGTHALSKITCVLKHHAHEGRKVIRK